MTAESKAINLTRVGPGAFQFTTADGQVISLGENSANPVELLLAAVAASIAKDVDAVTSRRSEPSLFEIVASTDTVRGPAGNQLEQIELIVRMDFPDTPDGAAARALAPRAAQYAQGRTSAIARALELQTGIALKIE